MSADIRFQAAQDANIQASADGFTVPARSTRDGSLSVTDWLNLKNLEGKVFHVDVGAFSTPITGGGAGTIVDADQPEALIAVPSGTSIMLTRVAVQCQTPLLATDADEAEIIVAVDKDVAATDGTSTVEVAYALRTDAPNASACTCKSAYTGDITAAPTSDIELARKVITGDINGTAANALWGLLDLVYEPKVSPIIVGPASVMVYFGGTVATKGFAQIEWAEFTSSTVT